VKDLFLNYCSTHLALIAGFPLAGALRQVISAESDNDLPPMLVVTASPWVASRARRMFDFGVAAMALLGLSPVFGLCAILVRCSSRGPVVFKQVRRGRSGSDFALYKFRTMRYRRHAGGPSHTVQGDSRITRVGRLLRRYKLDELPQFWNVLRGDMSLVGPRPKLPHHEMLEMPYRPGLTGQATLAFRHEERMLREVPCATIDEFYDAVVRPIKAELDMRYMEGATFVDDMSVLVQTMVRCLKCSVDARQEMWNLVSRHAPQHLNRLAQPNHVTQIDSWSEARFVPELTEDAAGDL
jgi:lipopolysaccharide/colanic/teichoic acid biosynthesis glycosyltransferase